MDCMKRFIHFVELNTKLASLLPFCLGLAYVLYIQAPLQVGSTLVFFVAMLLFDMTTTAVNNYLDDQQAKVKGHFSKPVSLAIIFSMLAGATALGLYLVYSHGLIILLIGVFCFFIGIFYTFGPIPISRSAYGEIFSGLVMGICIPALVVLINSPSSEFVLLEWNFPVISLEVQVVNILKLGIVTVPLICGIANVMLANNICDVEKDVAVNRFTLPYYIGTDRAVQLFAWLYYIAFAAIVLASACRIVPYFTLIAVLALKPIVRHIGIFQAQPVKSETFVLSVKNLVIMSVPYILCIGIGSLFV